jgi:outer membrane protein
MTCSRSKCLWTAVLFSLALLAGAAVSVAADAPLTLDEALSLAAANAETVKLAATDLDRAQSEKDKALKSVFPNLALSTSFNYDHLPTGKEGAMETASTWRYTLGLNQPLYTGGRATSAMRMADRAIVINGNLLALAGEEIRVWTTEAFLAVRTAVRYVEAGRLGAQVAGEFLDLAKRRLELGDTTRTSVLRAELEYSRRSNELHLAENGLALAREGLRILIGRDFAEVADGPPFIAGDDALASVVERALASRKEIANADQALGLAEEGLISVKGQFLPVVYANAYLAKAGGQLWPDDPANWGLSLNIDIPLYDRGQSLGDLKLARITITKAKLAKEAVVKGIRLEVERKWYALAAARDSVASLRKQVELAEEGLRGVRRQYEVGLATDLEVTTALADLVGAKVALAKGEMDLALADLELKRASGGL